MPQYNYRGRDKDGHLRVGQRVSLSENMLNSELINEGITPIEILESKPKISIFQRIFLFIKSYTSSNIEEVIIFCRQMQMLLSSSVSVSDSLQQLIQTNKSTDFSSTLNGLINQLNKGESLSTAMKSYPLYFSPIMVSLVEIGESTGRLSESFGYLFQYLEFESHTKKNMKAVLRYPLFILFSIFIAIITLNIFVIPTFSKFYLNLNIDLPWETTVLVTVSNIFVNYIYFIIIAFIISIVFFVRYIKSPTGKIVWSHFLLNIPGVGNLIRRLILIRFCQIFAIILKSGISINQGLLYISNIISNAYIRKQILEMRESIQRGVSFTNALSNVSLFSPFETQILAIGEKNGELTPALTFISDFHSQEVDYDLKRLNDLIGPILISMIALLILFIALGIYLPIWNMINLVHH